jgi:predicted transcriptional regulator
VPQASTGSGCNALQDNVIQRLAACRILEIAMPTTTFSMRIDVELKKALEEAAEREDRSASYIAQRAIEDWARREQAYDLELEVALKEAEKGVWISSEAFDKWMERWAEGYDDPFPEPDIFPEGYEADKAA